MRNDSRMVAVTPRALACAVFDVLEPVLLSDRRSDPMLPQPPVHISWNGTLLPGLASRAARMK